MKVLMVCLGNICRSPIAEGILKFKVEEKGLNWTVESAGTGGYHIGGLPDSRSIEIAKEFGIDITDQRARKLRSNDLDEFDLIYAMDVHNYRDILSIAHDHEKSKIKLILNEIYPNENRSVPDPYYGGQDGFKNVFEMLDKACEKIVNDASKK